MSDLSTPALQPAPNVVSDDGLDAYVRANIRRALLALLGFILVLGVVGMLFEAEVLAATSAIAEKVGILGLALILFVSDSVFSPIPPDAILIVIAKSPLSAYWAVLVPALGVMSVFAGALGMFFGRSLRSTRFAKRWFGSGSSTTRRLVDRYGRWAIALGALTPIPFSVTCWAAGMASLSWRDYWSVSWLRVPRLVGYYLVFAHADDLARLLF